MYYDLLAKIKNAVRVKKESFLTSFSQFDFEVAKTLVTNRYLKDVQKKTIGNKKFLEIKPNYRNNVPTINDFKIVSKPSRHLYVSYRRTRPVKQGYGLGIISTSSGIMTDRELRKKKIGGEYLFEIW